MDKIEELQQRIITGHHRLEQLDSLYRQLPTEKKAEIGEKALRITVKLNDLKYGFEELYPGTCFYIRVSCENKNRGTFHCWKCKQYLSSRQKTLI